MFTKALNINNKQIKPKKYKIKKEKTVKTIIRHRAQPKFSSDGLERVIGSARIPKQNIQI